MLAEHARVRQPARAGFSDATVVALVALAGAVSWLVLFYPGFMSADSAGQLLEARRGSFSDWHPPIMAALWSLCERVVAGPFGMLVLQTVVFWSGLALLAERLPAPVALKAGFLLLIGFAPPIVSIAGAIWKDVLLTAFLLLAFGLAGRRRAFWVFALLATLTRHNAIPAVAVAVLLHFTTTGPSLAGLRRAAVATLTLFVASLGINAALTEHRNHLVQAIALFDLVGIAATTKTMPDLDPCFLRREPVDLDAVIRSYDPRSTVYLVSPGSELHYCFDPQASSSIVREWLGAMLANPAAYLIHRFKVSRHLLGVHDTPGSYIMTRTTFAKADFPDLEPPAPQSALQARFEGVIFPLTPYWVFRPWIYGVVALVACAVATWQRLWWPFCIALSGLVQESVLFVVAPAEDYRYSLWMILSALIAAVWVAFAAFAAPSGARTLR